MFYKKGAIVGLVSLIALSPSTSVFAVEDTTKVDGTLTTDEINKQLTEKEQYETPSLTESISLDDVYSKMHEGITSGEPTNFSSAFNALSSSLQIPTNSALDVSQMSLIKGIDFGSVNLQYANLALNLDNSYATTIENGQSADCLNLFQNTYGDVLKSCELSEPTIPEGFTVDNMLSKAQSSISGAYSSVINDSSFAGIKNQISVGKIFNQANQKMSMPSLVSSSTMSQMLSESSASTKKQNGTEYDSRRSWINNKRADVKQNQVADLNTSFLESYNKTGAGGVSLVPKNIDKIFS